MFPLVVGPGRVQDPSQYAMRVNVDCGKKRGQGLLFDCGAVQGLAGSKFRRQEKEARDHRRDQFCQRKPTFVKVSGVGKNADECNEEVTVTGTLGDGSVCTYRAAEVHNSDLPGLLGLEAMVEHNCAMSLRAQAMYMLPAGKDSSTGWPQCTRRHQLYKPDTGHLPLRTDRLLGEDAGEAASPLHLRVGATGNQGGDAASWDKSGSEDQGGVKVTGRSRDGGHRAGDSCEATRGRSTSASATIIDNGINDNIIANTIDAIHRLPHPRQDRQLSDDAPQEWWHTPPPHGLECVPNATQSSGHPTAELHRGQQA